MAEDVNDKDIIGYGIQGNIYLEDGYAIKKLHSGSEIKINRLKEVRSRLLSSDIPTYPYYEIDGEKSVVRMTDLSNGKKNLVISRPDKLQMKREEYLFWQKLVAERKDHINIDEFFRENRQTIDKLISSNIEVGFPGFFLIVEPRGNCKMIVGDYDDGVSLGTQGSRMFKEDTKYTISNYFEFLDKLVVGFFPQTKTEVVKEINTLQSKFNIPHSMLPKIVFEKAQIPG